MIPAPLRLERYFFDHVQLTARRDFKQGSESVDLEVSTNLEIGQLDQPPGLWRIVLFVTGGAKDSAPVPPYEFQLQAIGFFTVTQPGPTEEETARLLGINGASILYSAAREYLLMLTGRGPWGPMPIPTVSFSDLQVQKQQEPGGGPKPLPKAGNPSPKAQQKSLNPRRSKPVRKP